MTLLLLGALITLVANAALQRWRYGREAVEKRCDDIEKAATDLAALSREYWLKPWPHPTVASTIGFREIEYSMLSSQARINGLAQRVVGLNALVAADFQSDDERKLLETLAIFLDQISGGKFEVRYRPADFDRARGVEAASSDYIVVLRELATRRWEWGELLRRARRLARTVDRQLMAYASNNRNCLGKIATRLAERLFSKRPDL